MIRTNTHSDNVIPDSPSDPWENLISLAGMWEDREDISDGWLAEIRSGWADRLEDLYPSDAKE